MSAIVRLAVLLLAASAPLLAQDAATSLPDHYRVVFENEWVKVTRVHYPPHAKLPPHAHTTLASAYVYLNDSDPVIFRHVGPNGTVTRKPTTAGGVRLFRAVPDETHEVENTGARPSDFLRVEFKTDPGPEPRSLRGTYLPSAGADPAPSLVQFENAQIRLTRLTAPAHEAMEIAAAPHPSVVVSLTPGSLGHVRWLAAHAADRVAGDGPAMEALRFEVKTTPK